MKKAVIAILVVLALLLSACRMNFMDDELGQAIADHGADLSVTVWGEYDFTAHYLSIPGGAVDIPVTMIDEDGFDALAADPGELEYQMLLVSGEIIGDDLFTPERMEQFHALMDRGYCLFFLTGDEDLGNRICEYFTGSDGEHTVDPEKSATRQYVMSLFKVMPGDPVELPGMDAGQLVPGFISCMKSMGADRHAFMDELMLRNVFYRYR